MPDRPKKALSLKQALALPLIPANLHGVRPIIEAAARTNGFPAPNVIADISSISILRTTLLAGLGHTLLPVMPLQHELAAGSLCAVPVDNPPPAPIDALRIEIHSAVGGGDCGLAADRGADPCPRNERYLAGGGSFRHRARQVVVGALVEVYAQADAQEFVHDFVVAWNNFMNLDRFDLA